jgi:hypothetical protein
MPERTRRRQPALRYRCPVTEGEPTPGTILMRDGPRARRAYRVLSSKRVRHSMPMMGYATWRIFVEPMSAAAGREEIDAGHPWWTIAWDRRG